MLLIILNFVKRFLLLKLLNHIFDNVLLQPYCQRHKWSVAMISISSRLIENIEICSKKSFKTSDCPKTWSELVAMGITGYYGVFRVNNEYNLSHVNTLSEYFI